jgi:dynactin complex subunit
MKKQEMIDYLTGQAEELKKELENLQESFNIRKEKLIRIDGALEALDIPKPNDHSDALQALAAAGM